jgi:hypothetical protein
MNCPQVVSLQAFAVIPNLRQFQIKTPVLDLR